MPSIFDYDDYRAYLKDLYEARKREQTGFSYATLAARAGFANKGFLHNVINGKKNLSKTSVVRLSRALKHTPTEAEYFENLVFFNQAADRQERTHFYEALSAVRSRSRPAARAQHLRRDQYEYYANWYNSAIRSLIDLYPFHGDYQWLARSLNPPISVWQAKRSVALLERLGLVKRDGGGRYRVTSKHVSTGAEVVDLAALNFHHECTRLAANAMDVLPRDTRNITGMTLGLSREAYQKVVEEAAAFRARVRDIVEDDSGSDRVYQLNLHLFPLSRTDLADSEEDS